MAKGKALFIGLLLWSLLGACQQSPANPPVVIAESAVVLEEQVTAVPSPTTLLPTPATPLPPTQTPVPATVPPTPTATPTPFYTGPQSPPCGQILPLLPTHTTPETTALSLPPETDERLRKMMPETAVAAWQRMLTAPGTVGLAAYRVGDEGNGVYLNADMQMPLASVGKLIHLAAYAEAVGNGQLDPVSTVPLADLDAVYLPNYDLGAHRLAVDELREQELIGGEPEQVRLEDVPWMMIRHSSNAAADYLQLRLGQKVIEETAVALNLSSQTAPYPWVGQFLVMANHTRTGMGDQAALHAYLEAPPDYGRDVTLLTDAYMNDAAFRAEERDWHGRTRRPSVDTQRFFAHNLNAHGSPRDYANLMARFAQNGLSNPESSYLARKYLEWPMVFPANQALFSNLGYKNGSLPGILTTVYYAYPIGETTPIVVVLFFRDLPRQTYRLWRQTLPHDEFARWLLADPAAISALRGAIGNQ